MQWIYQLNRARVMRGEKVILDDVTFSFVPGIKIGVVGPNGAGKSTFLRVMAGLEPPSNGDARAASNISVGLLPDHGGAWDLDARLEQAMDALRCPPPDAGVRGLSGGERRRVALCRLLLQRPDLLPLDEPTNHLDAESVQWLEQHLAAYPGTVVAVTHDRYFLDNVAQRILELDRGHAYPYQGNYTTYLDTKAARLRVEGRRTPSGCAACSANCSGFVPAPRPGRRKVEPGCAGTRRWRRRRRRLGASTSTRSVFRPAHGWAAW